MSVFNSDKLRLDMTDDEMLSMAEQLVNTVRMRQKHGHRGNFFTHVTAVECLEFKARSAVIVFCNVGESFNG